MDFLFQEMKLRRYIFCMKAPFGIMNKLGLYILMMKNFAFLVKKSMLMQIVKQKYRNYYIKYHQKLLKKQKIQIHQRKKINLLFIGI